MKSSVIRMDYKILILKVWAKGVNFLHDVKAFAFRRGLVFFCVVE